MTLLNTEAIIADGRSYMQVEDKEIYIIENFFTKEELTMLVSFLENKSDVDWYQSYLTEFPNTPEGYWTDKIYSLWIEKPEWCKTFTERLQSYMNYSGKIDRLQSVQRHRKNQSLAYHYDNASRHDLKYASVAYLNDNFVGGLLHLPPVEDVYFPQETDGRLKQDKYLRGIIIPPKAGNLVVFATTKDYVHGVTPMLSDNHRYAMVSFFHS